MQDVHFKTPTEAEIQTAKKFVKILMFQTELKADSGTGSDTGAAEWLRRISEIMPDEDYVWRMRNSWLLEDCASYKSASSIMENFLAGESKHPPAEMLSVSIMGELRFVLEDGHTELLDRFTWGGEPNYSVYIDKDDGPAVYYYTEGGEWQLVEQIDMQ